MRMYVSNLLIVERFYSHGLKVNQDSSEHLDCLRVEISLPHRRSCLSLWKQAPPPDLICIHSPQILTGYCCVGYKPSAFYESADQIAFLLSDCPAQSRPTEPMTYIPNLNHFRKDIIQELIKNLQLNGLHPLIVPRILVQSRAFTAHAIRIVAAAHGGEGGRYW